MYLEEKEYPKSEGLYLIFCQFLCCFTGTYQYHWYQTFLPLPYTSHPNYCFYSQDANGFALTTGIITYPLTFSSPMWYLRFGVKKEPMLWSSLVLL